MFNISNVSKFFEDSSSEGSDIDGFELEINRVASLLSEEQDRLKCGERALQRYDQVLSQARDFVVPVGATSGPAKVVPISNNVERILAKQAKHRRDHDSLSEPEDLPRNLAEWFDAGLKRNPDTGRLEGARSLPPGYERTTWASEVPIFRHLETGIMVWPVRLDVIPYFEANEKDPNLPTAMRGSRSGTTLFCYTSMPGFERLIAPSDKVDVTDVQAPEAWSEEIWNRIKTDRVHHEIPEFNAAPENSLTLCASEPAVLKTREHVVRATYRVDHKSVHLQMTRVGHCVALYVPTDRCIAVPGNRYMHVAIVAPPGLEEMLAVNNDEGVIRGGFVRWHMRKIVYDRQQDLNALEKVDAFALLEGLVNRATGQVGIDNRGEMYADEQDDAVVSPPPPPPETTTHEDQFEVMERELRETLADLEAKTAAIKSRLKKIAKAVEARKTGQQAFLLGDPQRMTGIQKHAAHIYQRVKGARDTLMELDPDNQELGRTLKRLEHAYLVRFPLLGVDVSATEEVDGDVVPVANQDDQPAQGAPAGSAVAALEATKAVQERAADGVHQNEADEAEQKKVAEAKRRKEEKTAMAATLAARRKRLKNQCTEFAEDVQEQIHVVGDHYYQMSGVVLREIYGGNVAVVTNWLQKRGDPNMTDPSTGWTALHMATSGGDPEMVQAIISFDGDLDARTTDMGYTCFHMAVRKTTPAMLNALVLHSVNAENVKAKDRDGGTPLLLAVRSSPAKVREEMVQILLDAHADPNAGANDGWSPMAEAVRMNLAGTARLLVQSRGNVLSLYPESKKTIWEVAGRHPGLQDKIKRKLNSKDRRDIEKQGLLGKRNQRKDDNNNT